MTARLDASGTVHGGVVPLTADQALGLFDTALASDHGLLVPVGLDLTRLRAEAAGGQVPALARGLVRVPARRRGTGGSSLAARLAALDQAERERVLLDVVRGHVAEVLGHASPRGVGPERAFRDLGFDSLAAVRLRNRLGAATGLRLSATVVFDHPTPLALARHLLPEIVPEEPDRSPAFAGLDALESALLDAPLGDDVRARAARRLRALLWKLTDDPGTAAGGRPDDDDLDSVSDDELFAVLDDELGTSGSGEGR